VLRCSNNRTFKPNIQSLRRDIASCLCPWAVPFITQGRATKRADPLVLMSVRAEGYAKSNVVDSGRTEDDSIGSPTGDIKMDLTYTRAVHKSLREFGYDEKWLQQKIADEPAILGLGDSLAVYKKEKSLPGGGRVDFVLIDDEDQHYEVEVMLGETDPSHIIRTIEYWDIERRRSPQKEHCAVIVAEKITSRFFNVISILNRAVPMIAIQLNALQVGDQLILHFTKVLDISELFEEEVAPTGTTEATDLAYWEKRSNPQSMGIVTTVTNMLPAATRRLTYNRDYIALSTTGSQFAWLVTLASAIKLLKVTKPTASKAIHALEQANILRETTGRLRDRVYAYHAYLQVLTTDTD
jgi:hypothetical protein